MKTVNKEEVEMRSEYDFSKGERGRYLGRIKPGDTDPRNCKVSVTIQLDADLLQYLKRRSSKSNTTFDDQFNVLLRGKIEPVTEQLEDAHRKLAAAKDLEVRRHYWAAWDATLVAISAALKAAINHERGKGNGIYDDPSVANQINLAMSLELLTPELCKKAELIYERVPDSQFNVNSVEDSRDAIAAAEEIIKIVERRIENGSTV